MIQFTESRLLGHHYQSLPPVFNLLLSFGISSDIIGLFETFSKNLNPSSGLIGFQPLLGSLSTARPVLWLSLSSPYRSLTLLSLSVDFLVSFVAPSI